MLVILNEEARSIQVDPKQKQKKIRYAIIIASTKAQDSSFENSTIDA